MAEEIFYKYIEFFLSEEDIKSMIEPESSSYTNWLSMLQDTVDQCPNKGTVYTDRPVNVHDKVNPYFIQCKPPYIDIKNAITQMNTNIANIIVNPVTPAISQQIQNIVDTTNQIIMPNYVLLHYYKEIYLYAHHHFDIIRDQIKKKMFGGSRTNALEQFKEKIRRQIKLINI